MLNALLAALILPEGSGELFASDTSCNLSHAEAVLVQAEAHQPLQQEEIFWSQVCWLERLVG
jgi:hypothetical protein